MSEYKKVKIGDFLTEREGRYKPDDEKISNYKRLEKIDFSGVIHISDKASKTDMIIVHPGDLVISGINVAKDAVAVYQGNELVCATIHYSSYTFDDKQVDLEYFKYFVKSDAFISALQKQVKGGIKTEIKPKHLLPLEITIPDLETQKEIVKKVSINLKNVETLTKEIESQKADAKQLRQNILQDAIEGKLTAEWRKTHPVIKGNPDFDAEALFEEIAAGKASSPSFAKSKTSKQLPPISDDEKPFEIPEGWKWVRLGEITNIIGGYAFNSYDLKDTGDNYVLRLGNIRNETLRYEAKPAFVSNDIVENLKDYKTYENDILISMTGTRGKHDYLYVVKISPEHLLKFSMYVNQRVGIVRGYKCCEYIYKLLISDMIKEPIFNLATGSANQANIGIKNLSDLLLPFAPYGEQKMICKRIDDMFLIINNLEYQISQREEYANQLMQSILKDAFEER